MPITFVGNSSIATGTGTAVLVPAYAVTAGNTLVLCVTSSAARTSSGQTDTGGGTWTELVDLASTRSGMIAYSLNHPGGTVDISATLSASATWSAIVYEFSGGHQTTPVSDSDSLQTPSETSTTIYAAPASGFSIAAGDIAFCACRISASRDITPASGWTEQTSGSITYYHAYWPVGSGSTNERGGGTHTILTGDKLGVIAAFALAADAGGQPFRKRWGGIPGNAYTSRGTF